MHQQCRQLRGSIICDDSHGVVTDADLITLAEDAFVAYDKEEAEAARHQAR